jgi:hypothetical protein
MFRNEQFSVGCWVQVRLRVLLTSTMLKFEDEWPARSVFAKATTDILRVLLTFTVLIYKISGLPAEAPEGEGWCSRQDSNLQPLGSKPSALSIELRLHREKQPISLNHRAQDLTQPQKIDASLSGKAGKCTLLRPS